MSAYVKGQGNPVISLREATSLPHSDTRLNLPELPRIDHELDQYFSISRQLEKALIQEKLNLKKSREEFRQLQLIQAEAADEAENKLRNSLTREEKLKCQVTAVQQSEKNIQNQIRTLSQQINAIQSYNQQLKANIEIYKQREESFKLTLRTFQSKEKDRLNHIEQLTQKLSTSRSEVQHYKTKFQHYKTEWKQFVETVQKEKKELVIHVELLRAKLEQYQQREESLKDQEKLLKQLLQSSQANEKSQVSQVEKLTQDLNRASSELQRYKSSWGKAVAAEQRTKEIFQESSELKRRLEEMKEILSNEKNRNDILDERVKKEGREKHIALTCLHTAEARLSQVTRELDELRERLNRSFEENSVRLGL